MSSQSFMDFLQVLDRLEDKEHLFYKIKYYAAPTVASIKPSSLIAFTNLKRNSYALWERHKKEVCSRLGVNYYELKRNENRVFVLFYERKALAACLSLQKNRKFLQDLGYQKARNLEEYLFLLKNRYQQGCPHELGVFLGYPLEDVLAFIGNKRGPCLASKYWKVYQDKEKALQIFKAYDAERAKVMAELLG